MTSHKLFYDFEDEIESQLLAIHTSMEMERLAFFINKNTEVMLGMVKEPVEVVFSNKKIQFTRFYAEENTEGFEFNLIENQVFVNETYENAFGLFSEQNITNSYYFLPELKTVPFLLKISGLEAQQKLEEWLKIMSKIPNLVSVYQIPWKKVKNKNYLIFN